MLHGDISNQAGITIGFRSLDFVIKFKEDSFLDKAANLLLGKYARAEVNAPVLAVMSYLFRSTDYNVDLVVNEEDCDKHFLKFIESFPYSRIVTVRKVTEVTGRLLSGDLTFYVDDDEARLSLVNHKDAVLFNKLGDYIRIRR